MVYLLFEFHLGFPSYHKVLFDCIDFSSQRDCLNYIRVLQVVDDQRLYVCGTNAFQPQCDYLVGLFSPSSNR